MMVFLILSTGSLSSIPLSGTRWQERDCWERRPHIQPYIQVRIRLLGGRGQSPLGPVPVDPEDSSRQPQAPGGIDVETPIRLLRQNATRGDICGYTSYGWHDRRGTE
ncbi:hypothetical protein B0J12DRAFT_652510 [Macrophomina phaseolina]|uniref:Uncharacterized protein n=1 Tax=Macrophomina phaseolina TaxID=35725 RepID=A0ABQ8GLH7_9PEZI|nr:hypothetical protein B0J12DRAFT_652510 [Macrophomina phaseolina]